METDRPGWENNVKLAVSFWRVEVNWGWTTSSHPKHMKIYLDDLQLPLLSTTAQVFPVVHTY